MLEDESGRIRLVGDNIKGAGLVTGIIIAVLGMETPEGDFEVLDYCFPGMAPQEQYTAESADGYMDVDYGKYFYSTTRMGTPILFCRRDGDSEQMDRCSFWTGRGFDISRGCANPDAGRISDGRRSSR